MALARYRGRGRPRSGGAGLSGPPFLNALALSPSEVSEDVATTINILNASGGSTITLTSGSLPTGLTLDGAARTISGTPTTSGVSSFTLREALVGASNTPRDTELELIVVGAVVDFTLSNSTATPSWDAFEVGLLVPSGIDASEVYFVIDGEPQGFAVVEG